MNDNGVHTKLTDIAGELRGETEKAFRIYDGSEVGVKGLPKGNGHDEIIDAVVTKVVEDDEEDNGDGEAV